MIKSSTDEEKPQNVIKMCQQFGGYAAHLHQSENRIGQALFLPSQFNFTLVEVVCMATEALIRLCNDLCEIGKLLKADDILVTSELH